MQRPGIDAKGIGYRPSRQLVQANVFDPKKQEACKFPSEIEERHPAVLDESMIHRRE